MIKYITRMMRAPEAYYLEFCTRIKASTIRFNPMRLWPVFSAIILLCGYANESHSMEHPMTDSIIPEIVLEERHYSYMYDFAMNSALHQYKVGHTLKKFNIPHYPVISSSSIYVITDTLPMDFNFLKPFIYPDTIGNFQLVKDGHKVVSTSPFISQYDLEILPLLGMDTLNTLPILGHAPGEVDKPDMAVVFSNLYQYKNSFYLLVGLVNNRIRRVSYITNWSHVFEFEWCESRGVVYPRRVSSRLFHTFPNSDDRIREIPSFNCPGREMSNTEKRWRGLK